MEKHEKAEFQRIIRILKQNFPAKYPVKVRTRVLKGYHGLTKLCEGKEPYFLIIIGKDRFDIMIGILSHEYGHVLSWDARFNTWENPNFHTDKWAIKYKEIYNLLWSVHLTQA